MTLKCGLSKCKQEFADDCSISEILIHLETKHNVSAEELFVDVIPKLAYIKLLTECLSK